MGPHSKLQFCWLVEYFTRTRVCPNSRDGDCIVNIIMRINCITTCGFVHFVFITEFRDCFSLYAREKSINSIEQLTTIMRSLGFSPTITEVQQYFTEYQKGKRFSIVSFQDCSDY